MAFALGSDPPGDWAELSRSTVAIAVFGDGPCCQPLVGAASRTRALLPSRLGLGPGRGPG